jgi:asparaginyl-tRNA synthetase
MRSSTRLRAQARSGAGLPSTIRARSSPSYTETQSQAKSETGTEQVNINGWLKSVRGHKNVVFAEITDGSTSEGLQAVFKGESRVAGYVTSVRN